MTTPHSLLKELDFVISYRNTEDVIEILTQALTAKYLEGFKDGVIESNKKQTTKEKHKL
jgi:hypothetical protein